MFPRFILLSLMLLVTGCVERLITVRSQPTGALVYLNDEEIGRTPVTVPFTFYGTYDVRLEHEGDWMTEDQAAAAMGITVEEVRSRIAAEKLDGREENGQRFVRVYYAPLWTTKEAEAPLWEAPGPDLIAEAVPGAKVHLEWDFTLDPVRDIGSEALVDRAKQMRALMKKETRSR